MGKAVWADTEGGNLMGQFILCHEQKAEEAYYLETIDKHIYTIEELCYYLWQYVYLLDKETFQKKLTGWIRTQLGMEKLADELELLIRRSAALEERVRAVFDSISYMDASEWAAYEKAVQDVSSMTVFERKRHKADDLVRNHKYYRALHEYELLLKEPEGKEEQAAAAIYHNMGTASCRMFRFRQGSEYFLKSFMLVPGRDKLREYKVCLRLCEDAMQEDPLIAEFPGSATVDMQVYEQIQELSAVENEKSRELAQLEELKEDGKVAQYYAQLEQILHSWNEECRGYMRE